jgi:hypothetical protein
MQAMRYMQQMGQRQSSYEPMVSGPPPSQRRNPYEPMVSGPPPSPIVRESEKLSPEQLQYHQQRMEDSRLQAMRDIQRMNFGG